MNAEDCQGHPTRFKARTGNVPPSISPKLNVVPQLLADLNVLTADAAAIARRGRGHFLDDDSGRLARHAADGIIIKVQEICDRLPDELKARHPDIPWYAIRGARNRLGHNYGSVDYALVWNSIVVDIPTLVQDVGSES